MKNKWKRNIQRENRKDIKLERGKEQGNQTKKESILKERIMEENTKGEIRKKEKADEGKNGRMGKRGKMNVSEEEKGKKGWKREKKSSKEHIKISEGKNTTEIKRTIKGRAVRKRNNSGKITNKKGEK